MTQASSKPKKPQRKEKLKFSDGSVIEMKNGQAGSIRQGNRGVHKIPVEKQNTELPSPQVPERDSYDDLEYPPPSRNAEFRKVWARGIENITGRENFDESHLTLFETYCSLMVNLRRLDEFIMNNGQTFRVVTIMGETRRTHPEVTERNKTVSQIAQYAKLLDLLPKKDKAKKVPKEQATEWE